MHGKEKKLLPVTEETSNQVEENNTRAQIVKPKAFQATCRSYTRNWQFAEFFQNKETDDSVENLFQKQSTLTPSQNG